MHTDFFSSLKFQYNWRNYQNRILTELEAHLDDQKLHIVAPPGSGKTILGLEVVKRLAGKTLVLSPTTIIRNQWLDRLSMFGLTRKSISIYGSTDLDEPKSITSATYQALHSKCKEGNYTLEGFQTLVLDEAHHLRNEWWRVLISLTKKQPDLRIVSLTATPPFDSKGSEWKRYESLCGPIDAEIFVTELVKTGTLVPHQDYFYCSQLEHREWAELSKLETDYQNTLYDLVNDPELYQLIANHPWMSDPMQHLDSIQKDLLSFFSMVVVGNASGVNTYQTLEHFDWITARDIPKCSETWLEHFLKFVLHPKNTFFKSSSFTKEVAKKLRRIGVLSGRHLSFSNDDLVSKVFRQSASKLSSVMEILTAESAWVGDKLRMVILTDRIRSEFLPTSSSESPMELDEIGVIPIFEYLRRNQSDPPLPMAVLTGRIIIVPSSSMESVDKLAKELKLAYETKPASLVASYQSILFKNHQHAKWTQLITELFGDGAFKVLIGTCALLGEGWDCPAANTLVMATDMASFASTNQIRGRVLRRDPQHPAKASHIWHLCARAPRNNPVSGKTIEYISSRTDVEFERMKSRFEQFEGVSLSDPVQISRGINRLHHQEDWNAQTSNDYFMGFAGKRDQLQYLWKLASRPLAKCREPIRKEIGITTEEQQPIVYPKFIDALEEKTRRIFRRFLIIGAAASSFFIFSFSIGAIAWVFPLPSLFKYLKYRKVVSNYKNPSKFILKSARVVLKALIQAEMVESRDSSKRTIIFDLKTSRLNAPNLSFADRNILFYHLNQMLYPEIDRRYFIELREGKGVAYVPLPDTFSKNRKLANVFIEAWNREFPGSKLIFSSASKNQRQRLQANLQWLQHRDNIHVTEEWVAAE